MEIENFVRNWEWVHRMTVDFVKAVPDDKWEFTLDHRRFGSFSRQLRHVVRGRSVYNAAMLTKAADWSASGEHYNGLLTRDALLAALNDNQQESSRSPASPRSLPRRSRSSRVRRGALREAPCHRLRRALPRSVLP